MGPMGQIGHIGSKEHFPAERDNRYSRIFLGAAWPALRPGWVVVVGEHLMERIGGLPLLTVLDAVSDERLWQVVDQAAALWWYYRPERVLADCSHVAALQFAAAPGYLRYGFRLEASLLCAMPGPFGYAFPILSRLRETERLEIPDGSPLAGELMAAPKYEDLAKLRLGDYPAIAALSFAVLELERREEPGVTRPTQVEPPGRILE